MRPNIVTEAGIQTRLNQWWSGITFIISGVVIVCASIYLVCLLFGYDTFYEICFLPSEVVSHFQVYRAYTAVLFHGSLLHVVFNMLALVPLGTELERIMGSVRLLYMMLLLATSNAIFHVVVALLFASNPLHPFPFLMDQCAIGFSGIIFSLIVIETSLSGAQSRSVFGLFNVPSFWYPWILLVLFQLLASHVSLLGHLCGIVSGFAYTYGLFNYLLPSTSFYSTIESSRLLSACVRRPRFILCTGGSTYGQMPTYSNSVIPSSGFSSGNLWRNISSWMPQRETSVGQPAQDSRFPGRGRTLGSTGNQSASAAESDTSLQARLLYNSTTETAAQSIEPRLSLPRNIVDPGVNELDTNNQGLDNFEDVHKKLVAMGFEKTQAEVALAAADGDISVAIEILMSQRA